MSGSFDKPTGWPDSSAPRVRLAAERFQALRAQPASARTGFLGGVKPDAGSEPRTRRPVRSTPTAPIVPAGSVTGRSLTLVERTNGAWATDSRPATMISRASVGLIDGDGRRFRMLLELDGLYPLAEEEWRDRQVRAGDALLLVGRPTPRCAVPSANPDTGCRNRDVLRELLDARGDVDGEACLGVYAEVLEPGTVRVGDEVAPV